MQEVAKFLREQFSQVPMLAADGSFAQYDKTAPIFSPDTHLGLALEEMLQAPWKAVKDISDPRVGPEHGVKLLPWVPTDGEVFPTDASPCSQALKCN